MCWNTLRYRFHNDLITCRRCHLRRASSLVKLRRHRSGATRPPERSWRPGGRPQWSCRIRNGCRAVNKIEANEQSDKISATKARVNSLKAGRRRVYPLQTTKRLRGTCWDTNRMCCVHNESFCLSGGHFEDAISLTAPLLLERRTRWDTY